VHSLHFVVSGSRCGCFGAWSWFLWNCLTRLETRTEESIHVCEYIGVKSSVHNESDVCNCLPQRSTTICGEKFEFEHTCWDPKDGELYLSRAKPGETLVEARSDTDVQIVRQTWI